jgi:hypothetical protein
MLPLHPTPLYSSISNARYQKKLASDKRLGLDEKDLYRERCYFRLTDGEIVLSVSLRDTF